jgi:monoamine oxidase
MDFDVAIVGGGAAGIGAARRLAQSRYSAVLLEADSRLGGRARSQQVSGRHIDLGCGWFHSADRNSWVGIAENAGIFIDRRTPQWGIQHRDLGFSKAEQTEARQAFNGWMERLEKNAPYSDSAADALLPACPWNDYIRTIVGFVSGGRLEDLSIADYLTYDEASTDNNWRAPVGYGSVIAGSMPRQVSVRLSTPVTSMQLLPEGVALTTAAGTVHVRAALLTASTCVLAGDALKLPAELASWREAARSLPLGRNEKLFLEIIGDAPFVAESQVLGNPRDVRTASYYIRPLDSPVIECFFGGEGARIVEAEQPAAAFDFCVEQLVSLFGAGVRSSLRPLQASTWSHAKYIGGAYSYALPGHAAARQALARPFDKRVFFAGEATSPGDFSTAHGAHDSGVRAANEALAVL